MKRRSNRALVACSALLGFQVVTSTGAQAQQTFDVFERPSRFVPHWPTGYLFEADPMVALYLVSKDLALEELAYLKKTRGSGCGVDKIRLLNRLGIDTTASGCTLTVVPHFGVRQMSESSAAVKPPTFNPYFEFTINELGKPHGRGAPMLHLRFKFAHYSNGQAGCTYFGDIWKGKDLPCERPVTVTSDVPNTVDGNFSTSFFEPAVAFGWFGLKEGYMGGYVLTDLSTSIHGTEDNWGKWAPGKMESVQYRTYGSHDYTVETRAMYYFHRFRSALHANYLHSWADRRAPGFIDWRDDTSFGVTSQWLFGAGLFVRRAQGYDYYNIGYGKEVEGPWMLMIVFDRSMGRNRFKFNNQEAP